MPLRVRLGVPESPHRSYGRAIGELAIAAMISITTMTDDAVGSMVLPAIPVSVEKEEPIDAHRAGFYNPSTCAKTTRWRQFGLSH